MIVVAKNFARGTKTFETVTTAGSVDDCMQFQTVVVRSKFAPRLSV